LSATVSISGPVRMWGGLRAIHKAKCEDFLKCLVTSRSVTSCGLVYRDHSQVGCRGGANHSLIQYPKWNTYQKRCTVIHI